jgi:S1-C subfamily serine protease
MRLSIKRVVVVCLLLLSITSVAFAGGTEWKGFQTVKVTVNGTDLQSDVPPILVEGHTMLPVRAVADAVGATVRFDPDTYTVELTANSTDNPALKQRADAAEAKVKELQSSLDQAQARIKELEGKLQQSASQQSTSSLLQALRMKVFRLDIFDADNQLIATGSAVSVGPSELVTNYHVIADASRVVATNDDGVTHKITGLLYGSKENDLAILRVDAVLEPVTIRSEAIPTGEDVVAIGSPEGLTNTISTGIISGRRTVDGISVLQTTSPISHGSSGGGLFDRTGRLVGVTFASQVDGQNLNFALPVDLVTTALQQSHGISVQQLPGVNRLTPTKLTETLQAKYPALTIGGKRVSVRFVRISKSSVLDGDAPDFVTADLDNLAFSSFLEGILTGTINDRIREVEGFLTEAARTMQTAYPGKRVTIGLFFVGSYANYPTSFQASEVKYLNGQWNVLHRLVWLDYSAGVAKVDWNTN